MSEISISSYCQTDQPVFEALNREWLERYFVVEPHDAEVLGKPNEYILAGGGHILLAREEQEVVGTICLIRNGDTFEVSKLAVAPRMQGKGIGAKLIIAALQMAKEADVDYVYLLTNSKLGPANHLYLKIGFINKPLQPGDSSSYARCDLRYEYYFR